MPITLLTGPANSGKAKLALDAVRRHIAHGQEPLFVLPTRADVEHYLRELAGDGTAMGVRVERFRGLVEHVAVRAGMPPPPLGRIARERVIAAIVAGEDGANPGLARTLGRLLAELQARRVTPGRVGEAFTRWREAEELDGPAAALPRMFTAYLEALTRLGRMDEEERTTRALDELRRRPALWGAQPVVLYGFDDLTPLQLDVVETLGTVVGAELTVSLAYEPGRVAFAGRAATFHALAPLAAEHRTLAPRAEHYEAASRDALGHLERRLFEPDVERRDPGSTVRLLRGGGERAELELVAAEVRRLREGGMAAEEIAVVTRTPGQRRQLIEEVFAAAGVEVYVPARGRFADSAIGSALIGLLRCADTDTDIDTDTDTDVGRLEDLLAWLRAPGLLERPELADLLELRARRAGARSAAAARALWEQRNWPLEAIDRLREAPSPAALIERAAHELERLFMAPRKRRAEVLAAGELDEPRALDAGLRALRELRELARADASLAPAGPAALADTLAAHELRADGRPRPGAVAVLDPLELRARRVRALFLCGLQEGVFPAPARVQPFLTEEERRGLAERSGLVLGGVGGVLLDALAGERYLLYAAVSRPQELLVLSWHVADDDGNPSTRSLFVDDVCDLFTEALEEGVASRPLGAVDEAVSPRHGTARTVAPLADELVLAELAARPWSASSLETWIACPVRWFVERMLRPQELEPEGEPLARGALAHAALRDVLEGLRQETGSARLTPARLPRARELLERALAEGEAERPLSVAPERVASARRRLRADLRRFLAFAAEQGSELEPRHLELSFGFEEGLPAFQLDQGAVLRGRIDRIDVSPTGEAVLYDYKNRNVSAPGRWLADGNLQLALYMRVAEELLGVTAVGGFYQPLSGEDLRPRGLLELNPAHPVVLDCVRGDARDSEDVRELLDAVLVRARGAAREAAGGALSSRPETCGYGGRGCMYPSICRCER